MEYEKIRQYQSLVAIILLLLVIFIRMPIIILAIFLWIIIFIISNQLCKNILFSFFISSLFLILYLVYWYKTDDYKEIESFEGVNEMVIEDPKVDNPEVTNFIDNPIVEQPQNLENKVDKIEPVQVPEQKPESKPDDLKISMMDPLNNEKLEKDAFDLDPKAFEDSDEDSDKDEKEENMEIGASKISSKQAYKAQKQLYDLTVATSKLGKQLESLSKPLKNGQKIIENLNKVGLGRFI
jgi:energy-coupling factor transporter transmembrane protein EcfT